MRDGQFWLFFPGHTLSMSSCITRRGCLTRCSTWINLVGLLHSLSPHPHSRISSSTHSFSQHVLLDLSSKKEQDEGRNAPGFLIALVNPLVRLTQSRATCIVLDKTSDFFGKRSVTNTITMLANDGQSQLRITRRAKQWQPMRFKHSLLTGDFLRFAWREKQAGRWWSIPVEDPKTMTVNEVQKQYHSARKTMTAIKRIIDRQ